MKDPLSYRVRASPDTPAIIDPTTGDRVSYTELDSQVVRLARHLSSFPLTPGDQLGILTDPCQEAIVLLHAAWRIGVRPIFLNPQLSPGELSGQLAEVAVSGLIAEQSVADRIEAVYDGPCYGLRRDPESAPIPSIWSRRRDELPDYDWSLDEPFLIVFTSGTEGQPTPIPVTMRNLLASAVGSAFRLGVIPGDKWIQPLPINHLGGLSPIIRSAIYGTTVIQCSGFEADIIRTAITDQDATGISLVPTGLQRLIEANVPLDRLRFALVGGAPTPASLVERCLAADIPIHTTYGLTETASQVATATPTELRADPETVGRPLLWTDIRITDESGTDCLPGTVGEIVVQGPTVSPHLTEAGSLPSDEQTLFTGDRGYLDSTGRLFVIGRTDDAILTGGETVYPAEVSDVLESHPAIAEAAVIGVADPEWGQRVAAAIVPSDASQFDVDDLDSYCRTELADFKCPKTIRSVESIPRTRSGTVDRDALRTLVSS